MKVHEYQGKQMINRYGIDVPKGRLVICSEEAVDTAKKLDSDFFVVKAQIHAGGRGNAGGVKLAKNLLEVRKYSEELLGKVLITSQTGPEGRKIKHLLVEEGCKIEKEYYLGLIIDQSISKVVMIASEEGGMEIEKVAKKNPEKIFKEEIDPTFGLQLFQARRLALNIHIPEVLVGKAVKLMMGLYQMFIEKDCSIVEINPLVVTNDNKMVALDAKLNFDENALFRRKDVLQLRDFEEEDPREVKAAEHDLNYITLNGNIGCMVNGAGLAMATMDVIKEFGGSPANFLDVGGSANKEKVREAFKLILSDCHVKGVFVNIFGGIMKCDVIAQGIVDSTREITLGIPLVVRLEGTNADLGKKVLAKSGLDIILSDSMADGAQKIVNLVK